MNRHYEYKTDDDLMVVTRNDDLHVNFKIETTVNKILAVIGPAQGVGSPLAHL